MTVLVLGGIDRLAPHYRRVGKEHSVDTILCSQPCRKLTRNLANVDGVVMLTDHLSHQAVEQVRRLQKNQDVTVVRTHGSGVGALRRGLHILCQSKRPLDG